MISSEEMISPTELIKNLSEGINNTETIWAVIACIMGYLIVIFATKSKVKSKPNIFWLISSGVFIVVWVFVVWIYADTTNIKYIVYGGSTLGVVFIAIFTVLMKFFNKSDSSIGIEYRYKLILSITLAVLIFTALASFISGIAYIGQAIIAGGILGLLAAIFWHNVKYRMNPNYSSQNTGGKSPKYDDIM